jgi:hypothetical protein
LPKTHLVPMIFLFLGGRLKDPHIIAGEVVQLFLHYQQIIQVLECLLYTYELNKGDK